MLPKNQVGISTVAIILIIGLSLGLGSCGFYFYTQAQHWKGKYQKIDEKHDTLDSKYESLKSEHENLESNYIILKDKYENINSTQDNYGEWLSHLHYYRSSAENVYYWEYMTYSHIEYWKTKERIYPTEYYPIDIF